MSYKPIITDQYKFVVKNTFRQLHYSYRSDCLSFEGLERFNAPSKSLLETKSKLPRQNDKLIQLNIKHLSEYPITFQNEVSGESFTVNFYSVKINYNLVIAKYTYCLKITGKKVTEYNYNYHNWYIRGYMTIRVIDLFKHYYYTHKELKNLGFTTDNPNDAKNFSQLIKNSLTREAKMGNKPFAIMSNMLYFYKIENNKIKWDMEHFLGQQIIAQYDSLQNSELVTGLLRLYLNGEYKMPNVNKTIIFDEPKSLVDAFKGVWNNSF